MGSFKTEECFFFALKMAGRMGKRCLELSWILLYKDLVELLLTFVD